MKVAFSLVLILTGVIAGTLGAQSQSRPVPPSADTALVFAPERGSLIVQLVDSIRREPLPGGFVELLRGAARFKATHWPLRDAPTDVSVFHSVPTGSYVAYVRRIGYDVRRLPVTVRAGVTDTLRVLLPLYSGCDICGEVRTGDPPSRPKPPPIPLAKPRAPSRSTG